MKLLSLLAVSLLVSVAAVACGDKTTVNTTSNNQTGISVTGTGKVFGIPDIVNLQLGVQAEAKSVADARETAARTAQAIIDSVKNNGVDEKDIQTTRFSISPQYETTITGSQRSIRGYRVSNVLSIKIRKIDTASKIIDDATAAGGNNTVLQGFSFTIDDPTELREQARDKAVQEAKARAEQLARLAGVDLGDPLSINENVAIPFGGAETVAFSAPRAADVSTPIEAGELEVTVTVNITYSIE